MPCAHICSRQLLPSVNGAHGESHVVEEPVRQGTKSDGARGTSRHGGGEGLIRTKNRNDTVLFEQGRKTGAQKVGKEKRMGMRCCCCQVPSMQCVMHRMGTRRFEHGRGSRQPGARGRGTATLARGKKLPRSREGDSGMKWRHVLAQTACSAQLLSSVAQLSSNWPPSACRGQRRGVGACQHGGLVIISSLQWGTAQRSRTAAVPSRGAAPPVQLSRAGCRSAGRPHAATPRVTAACWAALQGRPATGPA